MKTLEQRKVAMKLTGITIIWVIGLILLQRLTDQELPVMALWHYLAAAVSLGAALVLWLPGGDFQLQKSYYLRLLFVSFALVSFGFFMPPIIG